MSTYMYIYILSGDKATEPNDKCTYNLDPPHVQIYTFQGHNDSIVGKGEDPLVCDAFFFFLSLIQTN